MMAKVKDTRTDVKSHQSSVLYQAGLTINITSIVRRHYTGTRTLGFQLTYQSMIMYKSLVFQLDKQWTERHCHTQGTYGVKQENRTHVHLNKKKINREYHDFEN